MITYFLCTNKHYLAKLLRFVCCGPATTVASERDFLLGTDIITPKRNLFSDKRVECLSFV